MRYLSGLRPAVAALVLSCGFIAHADAGQSTAIVELFTSQGCSSCPPANANLVRLSKEPDILTLSFSVTYWDYLGWKDSFGKKEFTDRQTAYEPALGQSGAFTPQMVINGRESIVGQDFNEIRRVIDSEPPLSGPPISLSTHGVVVGAGKGIPAPVDIWLVQYGPGIVQVPVASGENAGETLPHAHVVHELQRLATWQGETVTLPIPSAHRGLKRAVIVQEQNGGRIVAGATD